MATVLEESGQDRVLPYPLMMNVKKRGDRWQEFDVVASSGNNVFLIEVKATLRPEYITLVHKKIDL